MGSLFQFTDIDEDTMAKKILLHKRHGGLEAPRNSLELPTGTSYAHYAGRDNILYAYHMMDESERNRYSMEAPMKKLISEDISKRSNRKSSAPSVVARLMGVDMLPIDSKPDPNAIQMKNGASAGKLQDRAKSKNGSSRRVSSNSNSPQQLDCVSLGNDMDRYSDSSSLMKPNKPKRREHPQEEELQKFKKEFEAWQAAQIKEFSKVLAFTSASSQLIAQENLNREKMFLYSNSTRMTTSENRMDPQDTAVIAGKYEMLDPPDKNGPLVAEGKESLSNRKSKTNLIASQHISPYQKTDVSAPSKIVILRPGPERMSMNEDSWNSSPSSSEKRGSIEDFLEEVKERLKSELQGNSSKKSITVRGGGIETPYWEKPSEPRKIAHHIEQQVRDSVTRDFGISLLHSESTRSYRSDVQLSGTGSPEFINRDIRRFLADRLKNVMKGETHREGPMASHSSSRSSVSDSEKSRSVHSMDRQVENKLGYLENVSFELEKQSRSFRREANFGEVHHKDLSPATLVRSLSAPLSGTSFGNLLLEDRHKLTGAQIRRKHEVIDEIPLNVKKKKDKFNIREKVSSFRYSLTLRGRLFRRKVQSFDGSRQTKNEFQKDINSGPTAMMSFSETHENFTEVPPSPASVCSSVHEDFWRQTDYSSPTSSCSIRHLEDNEVPHVFREINSNLTELRRKLNQLEGDALEETVVDQQTCEVEVDIKDRAEAYIRDLLVASGLYDGLYNLSLSKWDPLGKPISNHIFEEVEESYGENAKDDEMYKEDPVEKSNHKILLDLVNEALPAILRPPPNSSGFMQKALCPPMHKPPQGWNLLFQIWEMIRVYVHPPADRSYYALDKMLARDLQSEPWSGLMDDDVNALGRDFECQIMGDLIEEIVKDMQ